MKGTSKHSAASSTSLELAHSLCQRNTKLATFNSLSEMGKKKKTTFKPSYQRKLHLQYFKLKFLPPFPLLTTKYIKSEKREKK